MGNKIDVGTRIVYPGGSNPYMNYGEVVSTEDGIYVRALERQGRWRSVADSTPRKLLRPDRVTVVD